MIVRQAAGLQIRLPCGNRRSSSCHDGSGGSSDDNVNCCTTDSSETWSRARVTTSGLLTVHSSIRNEQNGPGGERALPLVLCRARDALTVTERDRAVVPRGCARNQWRSISTNASTDASFRHRIPAAGRVIRNRDEFTYVRLFGRSLRPLR